MDHSQINHCLDESQRKKRIKAANENREIVLTFLGQLHYWLNRFEASRDIDHLDHAEKNAEAARLYLPLCFQELSLTGLENLYWNLSAKQAHRENKDA